MKNRILVMIVALIIALPLVAGCGRTAPSVGVLPPAMAHPDDIRFENCLACHVGDQLTAKPLPHIGLGYTNKDCIKTGCHKLQATGSVTLPPTTTQPPVSTTQPPTSAPTTPVSTTTGSSTPPGTSATAPPTGATTPPTSPTTATGKTLSDTPLKPDASIHPAAYATLCLMCHGPSLSNQFPLPPTWDGAKNGSVNNPGTFTVPAGSPADHTGRTIDLCLTCHK